jgi:hypothetical protein
MKEGDQGTRRAGEAKEKEKRTKDQAQKKNVVIKKEKGRPEEENFVKKQVSHSIQRNHPLSQQGRCNSNCMSLVGCDPDRMSLVGAIPMAVL